MLSEGGYDGTSILSLSRNKAEQLYALHMTAAANMLLEILFEVSCLILTVEPYQVSWALSTHYEYH